MLIYLCICLFGDDELSMTMKVAALGGHSGAENICNLPSSHSEGREVWLGPSLHSASRLDVSLVICLCSRFFPGARQQVVFHLYVAASAGSVGQQDSNLCSTA